jgi:hypothetical protein
VNCSTCDKPLTPWDSPASGDRFTTSLTTGEVICLACENDEARVRLAEFDAGTAPRWGKSY